MVHLGHMRDGCVLSSLHETKKKYKTKHVYGISLSLPFLKLNVSQINELTDLCCTHYSIIPGNE